jgi:fructose-1,6-bisphosphatase I / sedoheptulose-1,7-bisphosphatase
LRLLYEANPMAFLIEQAGGAASTGRGRMLEVVPDALHQRVSFVFGARDEVARIEGYHCDANEILTPWPLYGSRGLFRAQVS